MNTSQKCNCCIKKSVCKYKVEYEHDCSTIERTIIGTTTEVSISCKEFVPMSTAREYKMDKQKQIAKNEGAMVDLLNQEMKELQGSQKHIGETNEMVEEMAKITCSMYCRDKDKKCAGVQECDFKCLQYNRCEALVGLGYRKIPEGADNFLTDYKKGFKEGVQAVQVQLEEGLSKYDNHYTIEKGFLLEWLREICNGLMEGM